MIGNKPDRQASTYLDVIAAQQAQLAAERQLAQLQGQRLQTSVFLVKALGGDWCAPETKTSCEPRRSPA